jgi:hypothetical protein
VPATTFTPEQVMLTLAGLAYRGFHDLLPGEPHQAVVRRAVQEGLDTLEPVRGDWELVWGPVTSRVPLGVFDSNAMYVVRHRAARHRHVVAVRGTNPVSSSDWLFGDFLVGTTVAWPYAADGAAISTSTALGFAQLQAMRDRPPSAVGRVAEAFLGSIGGVADPVVRAGRAAIGGVAEAQLASPSAPGAHVERILGHWRLGRKQLDLARERLQRAAEAARLDPAAFRRRVLPAEARGAGLDLLTLLRLETGASGEPLDVTVTGHSKGGALAATVALWLQCALESADADERWDPTRRARVSCHTFAGPTPGNGAFARQLERRLGDRQHHLRNASDPVAQVWEADGLRRIPALYGARTEALAPLITGVFGSLEGLDYRHVRVGAVEFRGEPDARRTLAAEVIHQHLDAYLAKLGLREHGLSAVTFFV